MTLLIAKYVVKSLMQNAHLTKKAEHYINLLLLLKMGKDG